MNWREVPPIVTSDKRGLRFEGLTELSHKGRTWACMGTGEAVRKALAAKAGNITA